MATPYGPKDDPSWPGHLSAWSKMEVGWLVPTEIMEDGVYSIEASELAPQARVIRSPYPFMEYLLIENRQPLFFDARLWTGGLVVYHIDDRAPGQQDRGYPGQEGWPRNGYEVDSSASFDLKLPSIPSKPHVEIIIFLAFFLTLSQKPLPSSCARLGWPVQFRKR